MHAGGAVNRRMDEWVKMENLDLTTVDISDSEGSDGKGCGSLLRFLSVPPRACL